jgi:transcriptional regulator with XRE-family HTH domain
MIDNIHHMDIRKTVGKNIKVIRDSLDLSQEDLAHLSGVHRTYISGLERGIRNPTITIVQSIAVGLKVSASKLLEDK